VTLLGELFECLAPLALCPNFGGGAINAQNHILSLGAGACRYAWTETDAPRARTKFDENSS